MTEDDTFDRLKQVPFRQMINLYFEWVESRGYEEESDIDFCKKYGWDLAEFKRQW